MEEPIIIDGYKYYSFITDELRNKYNKFLSYIKTENDIEYFASLYVFWYALEKELLKNLTDFDEGMCEKFAIIYNIKHNLEYIIVNKSNIDLAKLILEILILSGEKDSLTFHKFFNYNKNINCYVCNRSIYCKCHIYKKPIPFSLCRINKILNEDGVISEYKDEKLIHFCCNKCEEIYYIENLSYIKKLE